MKEVPFFNTTEFTRRLANKIGSAELAKKMLAYQNAYQLCLGVIDESEWPRIFDSEETMRDFKKRHSLRPSSFYDPSALWKIMISDLGVSEDVASTFWEIEEDYCIELGIM